MPVPRRSINSATSLWTRSTTSRIVLGTGLGGSHHPSPEGIHLAALSATVSNAEEFGEWLETVRGETEVIVDEHRPVPLWQQVMAGDRLLDLFVDEEHHRVNPEFAQTGARIGSLAGAPSSRQAPRA